MQVSKNAHIDNTAKLLERKSEGFETTSHTGTTSMHIQKR
jgi:hypothetical protein